jgi:type III restriction enzyme
MEFLYDTLLQEFGKRAISQIPIPPSISDNLKFSQRPYQQEAFQRFILSHTENFAGKPFAV